MKTIRRLPLAFYLPLFGIFLILGFLPDILIWANLPEGLTFSGAFVNIDDANVYFSAMRQGGEGAWLFTPQFTPEELPAHLSYMPYLITGKFQALFGGSDVLWFQFLRLSSALFALFTLKTLTETVFPHHDRLQKSTLIMALYSSGVGWLAVVFSGGIPAYAADLTVPEWNTVTDILSAPHFLLGLGAQALFFVFTHRLLTTDDLPRNALGLAATGIILGLCYPFLIPVDGLALAVVFVIQSVKNKAIPWRKLIAALLACLPMIAYLIYYGIFMPRDPVWQLSMINSNQITPPNLLGVLVGAGLMAVLGFAALKSWWKKIGPLVPVWFFVNLLCLYLPLSFAGRFVLGMTLPLALLAAYGLERVLLPRVTAPKRPASQRTLLLLLTLPSALLFMLLVLRGPQTVHDYPYYMPDAEVDALTWLGEHTTEEDVVLAHYPTSNYLPRVGPPRVMFGHLNLTIDLSSKGELVHTFFNPSVDDQWRLELIEEWGITYIYQGEFEQELSGNQPISLPGEIVYRQEDITIYRTDQ